MMSQIVTAFSATANSVEFDDQTRSVIEHVARYRLTVPTAARHLPGWNSIASRHIQRVLRQLQQRSLLASAPLHQGRTYWHLTAEGARCYGLEDDRTGPLSEPAKIRAYAILHHCCLSDRPRHRLTRNELERHFPSLYEPGFPSGYVFDPEGDGRLGLVRVDAGHLGRWDRIIESLREDVSRHWAHAGFRGVVRAGRFEIVLLTTLPQKAERIAQALQTHRDARRIPIRITAIPALLPLIASIPRKEVTPLPS
jgi:hypothetical protein